MRQFSSKLEVLLAFTIAVNLQGLFGGFEAVLAFASKLWAVLSKLFWLFLPFYIVVPDLGFNEELFQTHAFYYLPEELRVVGFVVLVFVCLFCFKCPYFSPFTEHIKNLHIVHHISLFCTHICLKIWWLSDIIVDKLFSSYFMECTIFLCIAHISASKCDGFLIL